MDVQSMCARDIMNRNVVKVTTDMRIKELMELMQAKHISGVPVVDEKNKFVGVVSSTDVIRLHAIYSIMRESQDRFLQLSEDEGDEKEAGVADKVVDDLGQKTVGTIMSRMSFNFKETAKVTDIAKMMKKMRVHRVFITDDEMNLIGVISAMDFVGLIANLYD